MDLLAYIIILYILIRVVLSAIQSTDSYKELEREQDEIDRVVDKKKIKHIKVQMEEHNGWWYGFYNSPEGRETFVAQGPTYDEALTNVRARLQEHGFVRDLAIDFTKS